MDSMNCAAEMGFGDCSCTSRELGYVAVDETLFWFLIMSFQGDILEVHSRLGEPGKGGAFLASGVTCLGSRACPNHKTMQLYMPFAEHILKKIIPRMLLSRQPCTKTEPHPVGLRAFSLQCLSPSLA